MSTIGERILAFTDSLEINQKLPEGIEVLNPYKNKDAWRVNELFYQKYYNDNNERTLIIGINHGRFGGGITGLSFTDPVRLEEDCHISNPFEKRTELSSTFIYECINGFGGVEGFFNKFFLSAVCPLGFVKEGKNYNYYDSKALIDATTDFVRKTLIEQTELGVNTDRCICLGEGKNYQFLKSINDDLNLFKEIIPLPHPRFIMQYKRKQKQSYIERYLDILGIG